MWYMVYDKLTGAAVSCGSVLADPMPDGYGVEPLGTARPDFSQMQWNPQTLALEPIPQGS